MKVQVLSRAPKIQKATRKRVSFCIFGAREESQLLGFRKGLKGGALFLSPERNGEPGSRNFICDGK